MSDRAEFEKWYDEATDCNYGVAYYVDITGRYCHHDIGIAWQAWQAALAKSRQGVEPVAEVWPSHHYVRQNHVNWLVDVDDLPNGAELYIHPQPAQQGSVPESIEVAIDMLEDYARALDSGDLDGAGHSTTSCIHEVIDELTAALQPPKDDTQ